MPHDIGMLKYWDCPKKNMIIYLKNMVIEKVSDE